MRRTIFGRPPEVELQAPARALAREAVLFDVRDNSESADLTLAERRLGSWTYAPWLVLAGHLIIAISFLFQLSPADSAVSMASIV
ncbi:MAG TPA: hypothetical protein VF750_03025, partial [Sphingomicrobium sp.]